HRPSPQRLVAVELVAALGGEPGEEAGQVGARHPSCAWRPQQAALTNWLCHAPTLSAARLRLAGAVPLSPGRGGAMPWRVPPDFSLKMRSGLYTADSRTCPRRRQ